MIKTGLESLKKNQDDKKTVVSGIELWVQHLENEKCAKKELIDLDFF